METAGPHQPFDQGFRWVLQLDPVGFARSILGIDVPPGVTVGATEYLSRSVKGDGLLLDGDVPIVQIEAQANPDPDLELRLVEYAVGGLRRFGRVVELVVVVLHPRADRFGGEARWGSAARSIDVRLRYRVVRLWELPPDVARSSPELAALLPLTRANDAVERESLVREAFHRAGLLDDAARATELVQWASALATLYVGKETVDAIQREEAPTMGVSLKDLPYGQELLAEGREETRAAWAQALHRQAAKRFGADPHLDALLTLDRAALDRVSDLLADPATTVETLLDAAS